MMSAGLCGAHDARSVSLQIQIDPGNLSGRLLAPLETASLVHSTRAPKHLICTLLGWFERF